MDCTDNTTYIPGQKKITPTGTIEITENGTYDVAQYANADVNVSGVGSYDVVGDLVISTSSPKSVTMGYVYITVPEGVESVASSAFSNMKHLREIELPSSLVNIYAYAFADSGKLKKMVVHAAEPPTISNANAFNNLPGGLDIYVPSESVEAYKNANVWSTRASRIQAISE